MGGKGLGFIDYDFPYHLISMSSCFNYTLFHTKEGLFINYHDPINHKPYYNNNENIILPSVILISCKWESTFVFTIDGLYALGNSYYHQLGDDDAWYIRKFKKISIDNIISIECGVGHTLILTSNGLYGCGISDNFSGVYDTIIDLRFGNTKTFCCKTPHKLNILNVISMSCGYAHSLVLTNDGLYGCGENHFGQSGVEYNYHFKGFQKININNILSFSCGDEYSIIMTEKGLFSCGYNNNSCYILPNNNHSLRPNPLQFMF